MPKGKNNRKMGNDQGADMFNRNELNKVHLNREASTDDTGEDMISGDNLMNRTGGRVE
ncbi:hypothetical protein [Bacillus sp. T33-2]|uniref:hypothetical protein n=1 Tax=Bacillus sp. T33-2 TaxID=2054168 RepID=UPI0015E06A29|nr:hypothetical protein [Bacillus sp. T33-2]